MSYKINPHALADWAIATGRLPLNGRHPWMMAFSFNPVRATGALLVTPAARDDDRPCPLFAPPRADLSRRAVQAHATRRARSRAVSDAPVLAGQADAEDVF